MIDYKISGEQVGNIETVYIALTLHNACSDAVNICNFSRKWRNSVVQKNIY